MRVTPVAGDEFIDKQFVAHFVDTNLQLLEKYGATQYQMPSDDVPFHVHSSNAHAILILTANIFDISIKPFDICLSLS